MDFYGVKYYTLPWDIYAVPSHGHGGQGGKGGHQPHPVEAEQVHVQNLI
jgi:hypothetical protein